MRHDQRQSIGVLRANVNEVNVEPVDLGHELRAGVQLGLCLAPVVLGPPVADDLLHFRELYTLRAVVDRFAIRPPRRRDAPAKLSYVLLRDVDGEWADWSASARSPYYSGE